MRQNICRGYFAFDRTQMVEMVVTSTIQRDTTGWSLKLWYSLLFTQRWQTVTKSLPKFKLDIRVSYVRHAFQTCHVITSKKCVQLLTKQLQNCFCLLRQNRRCLSNIHFKSVGSTALNYEVATTETLVVVKSFMLQ